MIALLDVLVVVVIVLQDCVVVMMFVTVPVAVGMTLIVGLLCHCVMFRSDDVGSNESEEDREDEQQ